MAQVSLTVIPFPLWCVLPCLWHGLTLAGWSGSSEPLTGLPSVFVHQLSWCCLCLEMDPVCEENLSSLTQSSFLCPVHNYRTWRSLGCFGDFISEGNTFLCNSFIISTLASFKLTALGPVLAEVSLVGWCSDVPSLSSFPLDMTSLYRLCLKQSTTAIFAISSNT